MKERIIILLTGLILFACNKQTNQKSQFHTTDSLSVTFGKFQYAAPITDSFPKYFATEFLLQHPQNNKPIIKTENALSAIRSDTSAFYIDPQSERFSLILYHSNDQIDTFKLRAFVAPAPKIIVKIDSQYINPNSSISLDGLGSIEFEFEMPDRFEYYYPKDCRYEISEGRAIIKSKTNRTSIPIINNSIDLNDLKEEGELIIQIDSLIRKNYKSDSHLINSERIEFRYEIEYGA